MHKVPYSPYFSSQFSVAYDAYLEICQQVDTLVNHALGYDTPHSRLLRSCPACFYKLENEPKLDFSCLVSIDGNNSLKRLGSSFRAHEERPDSRRVVSDRWITPEEVDIFRDEVNTSVIKPDGDHSDDWVDVEETSSCGIKCTDWWRNAGPEERKKMLALFDESGIFITTCRHRMVLLTCDMIKSGELAKYPLAIVDRLINILGDDIGCAYDIGCAFSATLENTSLAPKVKDRNFRLMVGAFHGHAHNRACQLKWHPTYMPGTGNTEGEGCEHVFSSSNDLARGTRYATRFHRQQAIEEHFSFWDEDKYANLSRFLFNHYREALTTIATLEHELSVLNSHLGTTNDDYECYLAQEKEYLESLREPSADTTLKGQYVQALNDLTQYQKEWSDAWTAAQSVYNTASAKNLNSALIGAHHRTDIAFSKLQNAKTQVGNIEILLGLNKNTRWTRETPEYKEFYKQTVVTNYSKALDNLERLVVMCLFELTKMSASGTGYKLRRQIGKALQRRSEAICNALNQYNTQATQLNPPRSPLTWKEIVDYSFLAEFELLRHSRADIRKDKWADPSHCEAMNKYFKLCRAREEIIRLDVEISRLQTSINDETFHIEQVLSVLSVSNPPLATALKSRWSLRKAVNMVHLQRLKKIEALPGVSGVRGIGVRLGLVARLRHSVQDATQQPNYRDPGDIDDDNQEDADAELATITDFVLAITD